MSRRIAQALDRLAERTGVSAMSRRFGAARTYHFRFLPAALMILAVGGIILDARGALLGYVLITVGLAVAIIAHSVSPLGRVRMSPATPDRQRLQRARLVGVVAAFDMAVVACLAEGLGPLFRALRWGALWTPSKALDWTALALLLLTIQICAALMAEARSFARLRSPADARPASRLNNDV